MTEKEARAAVCAGLTQIYGLEEGIRMAGTVVPGILNDYNQMVRDTDEGKSVCEEYRLEDGRAVVFINGKKLKNNTIFYEKVQVTQ